MALTPITPLWPSICALLAFWAAFSEAYFADWSKLGGRPHEPTCVDIPKNMSLCSDIGYNKMRLPNLLDHDTLTEVQQQSGSWVPLRNVRCHPHTKLFLCSLFTPVCLESQIYPCRSLCNAVQTSCESRMRTYGYDWPEMLRCDRFPEDNDMCIKAPDHEEQQEEYHSMEKDIHCPSCNPVDTYENILDNFCRADTVLRGRVRRQRGKKVSLRKTKNFKLNESSKKNPRRREKLVLEGANECCHFIPGKQKYLIMGVRVENNLISPTFVLPWRKTKSLRQAVRVFRSLKCDDPNLFTPTSDDGTILPKMEEPKVTAKEKKKKRKRNRKKKNKNEHNRRINKNRKRERKNKKNTHKEENDGE